MKSRFDVPTIPLKDAVARVTLFREQFSKAADVPEENIPRAILIPIDDLLSIIKKYEIIDEEGKLVNNLLGVRAYFAVKVSDLSLPDDVTALIVPVDLEGNDLINTKTIGIGLGDPDDTGIYDFTQPCPDQCDPESPLYVKP